MEEQKWTRDKVRRTFVEFFESKGHLFVPSSSVVPHEDPTLLFTNAGMNQFKAIFLGQVDPKSKQATWKRAANSQKCIRAGGKHNDLDDVGKDTYHHTFFEMLGNWSFGDYFKEEAIAWAWEILTGVYGLDKERMYATYFGGSEEDKLEADLEAREIWLRYLPSERVLPFGKKANFWEMGDTGPCGPCSEIHYDRIGGRDATHLVNCDPGDPTLIEIWNLVFIQFNREENGSLRGLPSKHVDTGMGFERLTSILQNVSSNYDTDIFAPIFARIQEVTGAPPYSGKVGEEDVTHRDMAYRVVADHIRTLSFAINDGAAPGPNDRNYVVRRILRRAIRFGKQILGAKEGFLHELVSIVIEVMGDAFPELKRDPKNIVDIIAEEEVSFNKTLDKGIAKFNKMASKLPPGGIVSGEKVFKLYDTYGFPHDLTQLMAEEKKLGVDIKGFEEHKKKAQELSRLSHKSAAGNAFVLGTHAVAELRAQALAPTDDSPKYNTGANIGATVKALWTGEAFSSSASGKRVGIVLDKSNFYAEQGGQIFDLGKIVKGDAVVTVDDVQVYGGYLLHVGDLQGELKVGDSVELLVDFARRKPVMSNHTATHLVNHALRGKLGSTVDQKGSLVLPDRLRFDFSHNKPLSAEELAAVDASVQEVIGKDLKVSTKEVSLKQALEIEGIRAVFGEIYPDPVRVVCVGPSIEELLAEPKNPDWQNFAIELCGGTHVTSSKDIECFTIIGEEALARGIRRVTALTGHAALQAISTADAFAKRIEALRTAKGETLKNELIKLSAELDEAALPASRKVHLREEVEKLRDTLRGAAKSTKADWLEAAQRYAESVVETLNAAPASVHVGILEVGSFNVGLTNAIKAIREKHDVPVLLLSPDTSKPKGSVTIVAQVPDAVVSKGLQASEWAGVVAKLLGGKGGGKAGTAQGSGSDVSKVQDAVAEALRFAKSKLE